MLGRLLFLSTLLATPALAQDPHAAPAEAPAAAPAQAPEGGHEAAVPAGAHAPAGEHAAPAGEHAAAGEHAEGGHGDAAHHGPHYTGDVDGDGTPNWLDPDADEVMGQGTYAAPGVGWHVFNFLVLCGVLVWAGRAGLKDALHKRAVGIRSSVEEAAVAKAAAEAKQAEIAGRLARLETEIGEMKDRARAEAVAEEARIAERAEEAARRIAETAQRQIGDETARARTALRAEAVDLAVQLAETILRGQVGAGDQKKLAEQFLASIEGEA